MFSVIGVSSLYQTAPADKPPPKLAALAAAWAPFSCLLCLRRSGSKGSALVASAIATLNSVLNEEAFKGLGGRSFTKNPLENGLEEGEDGGQYNEEDGEVYGPKESEGDELAIANLGLPQQLMNNPKKRGIAHLFPIQESMQRPVVRRPWSSGVGSLVAIANAVLFSPSEALAQLCDVTMTPTALITEGSNTTRHHFQRLVLMDLDPTAAKLAISILGPLLSAYGFLFILRIVMSWYPKLPVSKFPYIVAYAPTEPLLILTRKLIPPIGGVDVTPVVWFGLISFLNEILVGPQGLLVLLSQQV